MKLAKVTSASIEIMERKIMTFWVHVSYEEGMCQGVGGLTLDTWDEQINSRIGTAYGCEMLRQLLLFFGVNNLSEAKGQVVYVIGSGESFNFKPYGFKHLEILRDDRPEQINFNDIREKFIGNEK